MKIGKTLAKIGGVIIAIFFIWLWIDSTLSRAAAGKKEQESDEPALAEDDSKKAKNDPTPSKAPATEVIPAVRQIGVFNSYVGAEEKHDRNAKRMAVKDTWSDLVDVSQFVFDTQSDRPYQILINSGYDVQPIVEVNYEGKWLMATDGSRKKINQLCDTGRIFTLRFRSVNEPTLITVIRTPKN